jgi:hypothetical protein
MSIGQDGQVVCNLLSNYPVDVGQIDDLTGLEVLAVRPWTIAGYLTAWWWDGWRSRSPETVAGPGYNLAVDNPADPAT